MQSPIRRHDKAAFYKYASAPTARLILSSGALRWSSPLLFNDPFDIPREAELGFTAEEYKQATFREFAQLLERDEPPRNPVFAQLRLALSATRSQVSKEVLLRDLQSRLDAAFGPIAEASRVQFQDAWRDTIPRLRILCVADVNDSIGLWTHYAPRWTPQIRPLIDT